MKLEKNDKYFCYRNGVQSTAYRVVEITSSMVSIVPADKVKCEYGDCKIILMKKIWQQQYWVPDGRPLFC